MADVFSTLCTYAGVPSFWRYTHVKEPRGGWMVLAFCRVAGRWVMVDVANGVVFTDAQGRLADVERMMADPALMNDVAGKAAPDGLPYREYVEQLRPFTVPSPLRPQRQMPGPRLWFELRRVFHLGATRA